MSFGIDPKRIFSKEFAVGYQYDYLVFIGRFQPYHLGHHAVIKKALRYSKRVVVLLGSANCARSIRNPFTVTERARMIEESFSEQERSRILISPLLDLPYNDQAWIKNVQMSVNSLTAIYHPTSSPRIGLIGHEKDFSSYYLKMFPQWGSVAAHNVDGIDATAIRDEFFKSKTLSNVPDGTRAVISTWLKEDHYEALVSEWDHIQRYKKAWEAAPYPPVFVTVDAVVVQAGHILLVRRGAAPGEGLLALPGGFVEQHERLRDAALRELREETKIKVPRAVLEGSIKSERVFDHPHRSTRGRTITHAFLIELSGDALSLPKIKGSDDAASAEWFELSKINPAIMFEDHGHIIQTMLGLN